MTDANEPDYRAEWVHIAYPEAAGFGEVYGFAGSQGLVNIEGIRYVPERPSKTLLIYMHPASTLQLL
ncbi:MAG: alpha/beta hydrolase, partial [Alphaproteobacteria bacterium]